MAEVRWTVTPLYFNIEKNRADTNGYSLICLLKDKAVFLSNRIKSCKIKRINDKDLFIFIVDK